MGIPTFWFPNPLLKIHEKVGIPTGAAKPTPPVRALEKSAAHSKILNVEAVSSVAYHEFFFPMTIRQTGWESLFIASGPKAQNAALGSALQGG